MGELCIDVILFRCYTIFMLFNLFQEKFIQMINKYNNLESLNIDFVPGVKISHSDAHLLTLMSKNKDKKVSQLADIFGVTKGAVSQQIKKMEKRGLLNRIRYNDNFKEVFIELTDFGEKAVKKHNEIDGAALEGVKTFLDSKSIEEQQFLLTVIENIINSLDRNDEKLRSKNLIK